MFYPAPSMIEILDIVLNINFSFSKVKLRSAEFLICGEIGSSYRKGALCGQGAELIEFSGQYECYVLVAYL
jgi:hypothetical protein